MRVPPSWAEHAIWWQVYPLGAAGIDVRGPHEGGHGLARLAEWLDHAVGLGANGLSLGPVFTSATHGYDTLDHYAIDPRLGDGGDFDALLAACRARGVRVMLDGVFNHVGAAHPAYVAALAAGPSGPDAELFRIDWDAPGGPRPEVFEGHGDLVALNHGSDRVVAWVQDVMLHWLDRGADAWRLDAAYAVDPAFWARVLPAVRAAHPDALVVGEMIHGDYAGYVAASGLDSVTQYELWKAVWSSLESRNFFELDWTLGRHAELLGSFVPATFIGNHDVTRIASRVGAELVPLALAVLATVGGMPSIYYGDEAGLLGVKEDRLGGDDAVRPALPGSPAAWAGSPLLRVHQDLLGLRRRHPWLVRARTTTLELTNTRYRYRSEGAGAGAGEWLEVELGLEGTPSAVVRSATEILHLP